MAREFFTSKKFRYLCLTVYGLSVFAAWFEEFVFYAVIAMPWGPDESRPALIVYVLVALILVIFNGVIFSGIIISRYSKNNLYNKILNMFFIFVGSAYCLVVIISTYALGGKLVFSIPIYIVLFIFLFMCYLKLSKIL